MTRCIFKFPFYIVLSKVTVSVSGLEGGREEIKSDSLDLGLTSVHPTGIYFFCSSKIGWETELGLINLQQIRADHGKRPSAENVWKCDSTTTDTILPDCGLVKGLQMRITFWMNRAPIRRCLIEMWIMNGNVIQSKLTLSAVEWVAPVRPLQRVRAGLLDFTFFFPQLILMV